MASLKYWIWLSRVRGLSNRESLTLLEHFGSPERIYYASEQEFQNLRILPEKTISSLSQKNLQETERVIEDCRRQDVHIVTIQDSNYSTRLRNIYNPPILLYIKGHLPQLDDFPVISIVGTRSCSQYGLNAVSMLAGDMARAGFIVVSGLTRGIDAQAAASVLNAGGTLIGILPCGADIVYPRGSEAVYEGAIQKGALISEYPPGTRPLSGHFSARNRILSGISCGVLVAEAPLISGAIQIAGLALEQGRDVFAIPGPIDMFSCQGSNRLIRDGAALVSGIEDLISEYGYAYSDKLQPENSVQHEQKSADSPVSPQNPVLAQQTPAFSRQSPVQSQQTPVFPQQGPVSSSQPKSVTPRSPATPGTAGGKKSLPVLDARVLACMSEDQIKILNTLSDEPLQVDEIIFRTGLSAQRVLAAMTILEIDEMVAQHSGKCYTRLVLASAQ